MEKINFNMAREDFNFVIDTGFYSVRFYRKMRLSQFPKTWAVICAYMDLKNN